VLATVKVVKLGLGNGIVDVDGREEESTSFRHLVKTVHTGGGLLGHTDEASSDAGPLGGVLLDGVSEKSENNLELSVVSALRVGEGTILGKGLLSLDTLVDEKSGISSIIDDHVRAILTGPVEGLVGAPPVLLKALVLPGEHRGARSSNGSSSMILSREDVARAPTHIGTKGREGLNESGSLDSHVQRTHDASALQRLRGTKLLAARHQSRHFDLGKVKFTTTKVS